MAISCCAIIELFALHFAPPPPPDSSLFCSHGAIFVYVDTLHPYRLDKTVAYVVSAI